ncbi:hypothetical protein N9578_00860 [bacterium]|jgi:hypothetical protein|nr:hypothetical protein [bacterium]MDB4128580.1 hypothetical protein [bacterium]
MTKVTAFGERILATMLERPGGHRKLASGLLLADKDRDTSGIRPRWFQIESIGEKVDFVKEGDYVYVAHGRWSNQVKMSSDDPGLWLLDNKEILAVSDEYPVID